MLLALTIISTVAGVIAALAAVWALRQQRTPPQAPVILVNVIRVVTAEHQPDHLGEVIPSRGSISSSAAAPVGRPAGACS